MKFEVSHKGMVGQNLHSEWIFSSNNGPKTTLLLSKTSQGHHPAEWPEPLGQLQFGRNSFLSSIGHDEILFVEFNNNEMSLNYEAQPGLLHYFRLADATLLPLPPEYAPARHKLAPGQRHLPPLRFSAGDTYIAVSPGVAHIADSPAIARFLHLRDYFNAEKLCAAFLAHLEELAAGQPLPEGVTILVVEAR